RHRDLLPHRVAAGDFPRPFLARPLHTAKTAHVVDMLLSGHAVLIDEFRRIGSGVVAIPLAASLYIGSHPGEDDLARNLGPALTRPPSPHFLHPAGQRQNSQRAKDAREYSGGDRHARAPAP